MMSYKIAPAMAAMSVSVPPAAIAEGAISVPAPVPAPMPVPVPAPAPPPSIDCLFTLKACGAFMFGDAVCCLPFCHCCGGCCGKYDACVVHAVGPALAGVTKPGPDRCWHTCMFDMYACSAALLCCGCFLCGCGLGAPLIKGIAIKTERNRDVATQYHGHMPHGRMVR